MSEEQIEPGELTERFRAFSESADPQPARVVPPVLVVSAIVAVAVIVVVGVVWLLLAS